MGATAGLAVPETSTLVLLLAAAAAAAAAAGAAANPNPVVRVQEGLLRGELRSTVRLNRTYASFRGVPYARPPLGALRFQAPEPAEPWAGVRDALAYNSECTQMRRGQLRGSEDCLFLNVFTPAPAAQGPPLPVIVFVPGGAFAVGSSNKYRPDYFMETGGCVLAMLNYRLGPLGFASLGTREIPGNAGLWDQRAALLWVRDNIRAFGGDPGRVTLLGHSAGAASVHAHLLSPHSAGLFQGAVAMSGSLLAPWAMPADPLRQRALLLDSVGCGRPFPAQAAACLRAAPAERLVRALGTIRLTTSMLLDGQLPFTPVVDGDFLPDWPRLLIRQGSFSRVPFVTGVTSAETLYPLTEEAGDDTLPARVYAWLQRKLRSVGLRGVGAAADLATSLSLRPLVQVTSDYNFVWPALRTGGLQVEHQPRQYLYQFRFQGGMRTNKQRVETLVRGVSHEEDMYYLFAIPESNFTLSEDSAEVRTVRLFVNAIVGFATSGAPTPMPGTKWPPYSRESPVWADYPNSAVKILVITRVVSNPRNYHAHNFNIH